MSTIAQILEANDTLCMDDEHDRATLARALREGLAAELKELAAAQDNYSQAWGIEAASEHIDLMKDEG